MLYIFDLADQLLTVLKNDGNACPYSEPVHHEKLGEENTLEFMVPADHPDAQYITEGNQVAFEDLDGWQLFEIKRVIDRHDDGLTRWAYCEHAYYELLDDLLEDVRPTDCSAAFALGQALQNSRWEPGTVDDLGTNSTMFYYSSALAAVAKVAATWGGELQFRINVVGGAIANRYVDLLTRRGNDTGRQFEYTKDLDSIERELDMTGLCTALYGRGKGVEVGDGYGRRLTFADVEWSTANGDPVDKPVGQEWVGDQDALAQWGRDGGTRHRFGIFEDDEETDAATLLQKTWNKLQEVKEPAVSYKMNVIDLERLAGYDHEKVRLGDTVRVIDRTFSPELLVSARVIEIKRNLVDPTDTEITLGNFLPHFAQTTAEQATVTQKVKDRAGVWDKATYFEPGQIPTDWLDGIIDLLQNQLQATTTNFYTDANGAFIWEAADGSSALKLAGGIFGLANEKDPVTGEWVWRTFGTGDGFTADLLNAGQIRTSLVQILGNSNFYWDGDYLYIVNPDDGNQQIRLSKEGIRFTKDGGQTWLVAMDFDGIRMEGQSQDGHTHYTGDGVKVYDEQGNLVGHLGSFEVPSGQTATFTRNSIAYKQNGQQVAVNQPRFEQGKFGQAVMVEEGTTNLSSFLYKHYWGDGYAEAVWEGEELFSGIPVFGIQNIQNDSPARLYVGKSENIGPGKTYSVSVWAWVDCPTSDDTPYVREHTESKTNGYEKVKLNYNGQVLPLKDLPQKQWIRLKAENIVADSDFLYTLICVYIFQENEKVFFTAPQIEKKPYATSFIDGTRSPETLTIPTAGVLNPQDGMVECWVYVNDLAKRAIASPVHYPTIFALMKQGVGLNNSIWLIHRHDSSNWSIAIRDETGTTSMGVISDSYTPNGWHLFTVTWNKEQRYVKVYIDGVLRLHLTNVSLAASYDYLQVGDTTVTSRLTHLNSLIDDLRISSRARTDEEILAAYQSGQPVDEWTTWKSSFNGYLHNEVPVRKYGLRVIGGEIVAPYIEGGEIVAPYIEGGEIVAPYIEGGEMYSTSFQTGEKGASNYIKLSSGDEPLLVVNGKKEALSIWASNRGGFIQFFDPFVDDMRGQILPYDDVAGQGLRIAGRNNSGYDMSVDITGSGINIDGQSIYLKYSSGDTDVVVWGDFSVTGSKNARQLTQSYGYRLLYSREGPESKFIDEGQAKLVRGVAQVNLDPIFLECIEPHSDLTPWIIKLTPIGGPLDLYVAEIGPDYFVVKEPDELRDGKFTWQLSAFRKGYANRRLDPADDEGLLTLDEGEV